MTASPNLFAMLRHGSRGAKGWIAAATIVALIVAMPASGSAAKSQPCGTDGSKTVAGNSQVRVYRVSSKSKEPVIFGCLRQSGKATRIGPIQKAGRKASVHGPFALKNAWVSAVEERPAGSTATRAYVTAREIRTGKSRYCLIGSSDKSGRLLAVRVLLIDKAGAVAWAAIAPTPDGRAPQIGACDSQGNRILDAGAGIEIDSLELRGSTLSWVNAGGQRTAQLH